MDRIKLTRTHCEHCGDRKNNYIEKESTVGVGFMLLILGMFTVTIFIGIPFIVVGIYKICNGYRWKVYCASCGDFMKLPKRAGEEMIRMLR